MNVFHQSFMYAVCEYCTTALLTNYAALYLFQNFQINYEVHHFVQRKMAVSKYVNCKFVTPSPTYSGD